MLNSGPNRFRLSNVKDPNALQRDLLEIDNTLRLLIVQLEGLQLVTDNLDVRVTNLEARVTALETP